MSFNLPKVLAHCTPEAAGLPVDFSREGGHERLRPAWKSVSYLARSPAKKCHILTASFPPLIALLKSSEAADQTWWICSSLRKANM